MALEICTISAKSFRRGDFRRGFLRHQAALHVRGAVSEKQATTWAKAVLEAEEHWLREFKGQMYTLGRAWYAHVESGKAKAYKQGALASNQLVDSVVPGLSSAMRSCLTQALKRKVVQRKNWCGAGVHVFTPKQNSAGAIHYDVEGDEEAEESADVPLASGVLMLQPPERGGELRLWGRLYDPKDGRQSLGRAPNVDYVEVKYEPGDFVVFNSYRLHQIRAHRGNKARVSATLHAIRRGGRWESWF